MSASTPLMQIVRSLMAGAALTALAGCNGFLSGNGPSTNTVMQSDGASAPEGAMKVAEIDTELTNRLRAAEQKTTFSKVYGDKAQQHYVLGKGDVLRIIIWETPPSMLFGDSPGTAREGNGSVKSLEIPRQRIDNNGHVSVPFVGSIEAAGKTPAGVEAIIVQKLRGRANQPQVFVERAENLTQDVTIVGDFDKNMRMPLTAKGERLLDAVAAAGGVRQPVDKVSLQLTRGERVSVMPMQRVIQDPSQNIQLAAGDVVTALNQPLKLSVLGATNKNEELNFEAQGITLVQALARAGGLSEATASVRGVFIFRFEDPAIFPAPAKPDAPADAKQVAAASPAAPLPVIYRLDMAQPESFFLARNFTMKDGDVLYVSSAPSADFQKFLNIVASAVFTVSTPFNTF